jgi:uncharacterized RDD family membrane protein YckC
LKADPKAPGSLSGDVLIDSDGGPGTIRVTATAGPPSSPPTSDSPNIADPRGYYQGDKLATWWQRVGAHLIDSLALAPGITLWTVGAQTPWPGGPTIGILVTVAIWLYNRCYLQGRTGQSWGKLAVGLKLIRMSDKEPIGSWKAAIRNLVHVLDIPTLYLLPIWLARRQTLADKTMKTVVISLKA